MRPGGPATDGPEPPEEGRMTDQPERDRPVIKGRRAAIVSLVPVVLGVTIGLLGIAVAFPKTETRFEDLALGAETTSVFVRRADATIHGSRWNDLPDLLAGHRARGARPVVLWLGNSQVHAINQFQPGQETGVGPLFDRLNAVGLDLLTFSQPNANLQEQYVLFEYLRHQLPVRILVLPAVLDDTREDGVRADLTPAFSDPSTAAALTATEIGRRLVDRTGVLAATDPDIGGVRNTLQEWSERNINAWLDRHWNLWQRRAEVRGRLFSELYLLRNRLLGIRPTTQRRILRGPYAANIAALEAILAAAKAANIRTLVYIVPLRQDVAPPYDSQEYSAFKRQVEVLAARHDARFENLERLVPSELWGRKDATSTGGEPELDFMHFQAAGHSLLADALFRAIEPLLPTAGHGP